MSYVPEPGPDGLRRYNRWGGNPQGTKEDVLRCVVSVHEPGRGFNIHQCERKRGHGPGGIYCKQHDPEAVARRADESWRRHQEKMDAIIRPSRVRKQMLDALKWAHKNGACSCLSGRGCPVQDAIKEAER